MLGVLYAIQSRCFYINLLCNIIVLMLILPQRSYYLFFYIQGIHACLELLVDFIQAYLKHMNDLQIIIKRSYDIRSLLVFYVFTHTTKKPNGVSTKYMVNMHKFLTPPLNVCTVIDSLQFCPWNKLLSFVLSMEVSTRIIQESIP